MTDRRTPEQRAADRAAYEAWAHVESGRSHIALCREGLWWCPCWCHHHGHPRHARDADVLAPEGH